MRRLPGLRPRLPLPQAPHPLHWRHLRDQRLIRRPPHVPFRLRERPGSLGRLDEVQRARHDDQEPVGRIERGPIHATPAKYRCRSRRSRNVLSFVLMPGRYTDGGVRVNFFFHAPTARRLAPRPPMSPRSPQPGQRTAGLIGRSHPGR